MNPRDRLNQLLQKVTIPRWLFAGVYGGIAGGFATSWLLWGWPSLLRRMICFIFKVPLALVMLIGVSALGCSFILTAQTVVRALRQLFGPPPPMYEPQEYIQELHLIQWPHPGCGLLFLAPILVAGAVFSLPWFWFAPRQVPLGWLLLSAVVGLPVGLWIASKENREQSMNEETEW